MFIYTLTLYFFIAILISMYLLSFITINGHSPYLKEIILMIVSLVVYIFGYMMEINAKAIEQAMFWNQFQYLTLPLLSAIWFIVTLRFTKKLKRYVKLTIVAVFFIPLVTIILRFTNDWHHLYYTDFTFEIQNGLSLLGLGRGLWYYVQIVYSIMLIFAVTLVFGEAYLTEDNREKKRYAKLALTSFITLASILMTAINPIILGLDYAAILLPVPIILVAYLILREDLFEINTLARNELFDTGANAIIILNDHGSIVDYNQKAIALFDRYGMKLERRSLAAYKGEYPNLIDALNSQEQKIIECSQFSEQFYLEIATVTVKNSFQGVSGYIKTITDVTEPLRIHKHLEYIAKTDELSQLFNRREFIKVANALIDKCEDSAINLHLLMIDIDFFKNINDTYGHLAGDEVIIGISKCLKDDFRDVSVIARFGGEEFVVMIENLSSDEVFVLAEAFREKIKNMHFVMREPLLVITVSIGIASYVPAMTLDSLISESDRALYRAKERGRDRVEFTL